MSAYEAKTHLAQILERVKKGEQYTITKHGSPIALLVPVEPPKKKDLRTVIDELKRFNKGYTSGITIRKMIEEGRR
ncbi:MAG: type II toxin-antitoxin system prevent-host-death family antitoxin [Deltaproteobacteria bacterium]|nr:type II toxin-antitoxin system prevent-host-death family antitoxin [Deltaproteobacteria bacterium]